MYPIDRRKLAAHVYTIFRSLRKTAIVLQVAHSTIHRWLKNPTKKRYERTSIKTFQITEIIKATIASNPFITTRSFEKILKESLQIDVSRELIRVVIKKLGFSTKKAKFFAKTKDLEGKTKTFIDSTKLRLLQDKYFVSLDETSFGRYGKPVYGYSKRGVPLVLSKKPPNGKSTSVLAVIDANGLVYKEHHDGAYNKVLFSSFLSNLQLPKGTIILLDNVAFHHAHVVKELAVSKGWELLYAPPYSPWFNPIEEAFSIVKRSYYKTWDIATAFDSLTPSHCSSFFRHMIKKLK